MSIVAECPHCESRYNLQPDLVGKAMRCPNPDCREVFVVREVVVVAPPPPPAEREPEPPPLPDVPHRIDAPSPAFVSGTVGDMVPVLEVEPASPAPTDRAFARVEVDEDFVIPVIEGERATPARPALPTAQIVADKPVFEAEMTEGRMARPSPTRSNGPKEVVWSDTAAPLAPPGAAPAQAVEAEEEDDEPLRRRRSRRAIPAGILVGLVGMIFASASALAFTC